MSTYKLYYFNGRGRAEVSRLIFAAAGQNFEDVRYDQSQWASHKSEMPLGQIPVLEIDGIQLPQSITIARFLAKQFQLAGKDNLEQAKVDAIADTIQDLAQQSGPYRREQDPTKKKELIQKFIDEEIPKHLPNLEKLAKLYGNGGPFFLGNHLTWADLLFYETAEFLLQLDEHILNKYQWLKQNRQEVAKQPKIEEYLKNRPQTPF